MPSKKLFLASVLFFVLVTLPFIGSVGASLELWSQTYGGTGGDMAYSLVVTSDGGFALAGVSSSFGGFWLVKTDAQGIPEFPSWTPLIVTLTAVLVVAVIYRHYLNKYNQGRRKSEKVCISACSVDINTFA